MRRVTSIPPPTPAPRRQGSWDWRAASNFIAGGAGSGLVAFAAAAALAGAGGARLALPLVTGLVMIVGGLLCVWLEIGHPERALNVFLNLRRSWMSREALAALLLVPTAAVAALGVTSALVPALVLALAFVYCQARILQRARGIAAWREPAIVPFIVATGLIEGAGLYLVVAPPTHDAPALLALFGALALLRLFAWFVYRRRVARGRAPVALGEIDRAGVVLQLAGTLVPLLLAGWAAAGLANGVMLQATAGLAGLAAAFAGGFAKYVLVTRAGFHEGFSLPHWPVRGAPR